MYLFHGARWVHCTSPIEIFSNLKEEAGSVDKFLKWDLLIVSYKFGGNLQKLDGSKTTIRRSHLWQDYNELDLKFRWSYGT
jgi:hypothetical protein